MSLESSRSILFVTGSLSDESSGPYLSLKQTADALERLGYPVTIVGTRSSGDPHPQEASNVNAFRRYGPNSLHFTPGFSRWLEQQPSRWDVVSLQGLWLYNNKAVANWCVANKKPFIITTHGALNPIAVQISAWKKALARMTFMRRVLDRVECYQALTETEYRTMRNYGIRKPICVVGNGINLPEQESLSSSERLIPRELAGRRTCLYLGRLFPIKGIDRLLRAWGRVQPSDDWQLIIAGGGEASYRQELESVAAQSRCRNVHFIGFVSGELKSAWLRKAEFYVLPSHSEAFPMACLEAFSYGVPALLTTGCGLPEAAQAGAAIEIESSETGLFEGLSRVQSLSSDELRAMSANAIRFVRDRHNWQDIGAQLADVYDWMTGNRSPPACVRFA
ncbi:glycosyltransferase [Mesorhizobium tianshanense]|uniref:Glycosyltransferase involved in cell wall biosynthesis n=1 Tax=Mesorhizobium tianshanense TaxID=39844 RepID=A0A562NRX6_9HYPH|nr:glycosyltransferase [Mesorhizobium tianshanense]TWI34801.1 glycosyltransferase involved in cell wall biosynthesis [Mesorhizobium tianshanense]